MTQPSMPHTLKLLDRSQLTITGVTEVLSFDDNTVALQTALGTLLVQGEQLGLKNLTLENGEAQISGTVFAMSYEEPRQKGSWRQRLFG